MSSQDSLNKYFMLDFIKSLWLCFLRSENEYFCFCKSLSRVWQSRRLNQFIKNKCIELIKKPSAIKTDPFLTPDFEINMPRNIKYVNNFSFGRKPVRSSLLSACENFCLPQNTWDSHCWPDLAKSLWKLCGRQWPLPIGSLQCLDLKVCT